jgi:hypothetical protein
MKLTFWIRGDYAPSQCIKIQARVGASTTREPHTCVCCHCNNAAQFRNSGNSIPGVPPWPVSGYLALKSASGCEDHFSHPISGIAGVRFPELRCAMTTLTIGRKTLIFYPSISMAFRVHGYLLRSTSRVNGHLSRTRFCNYLNFVKHIVPLT